VITQAAKIIIIECIDMNIGEPVVQSVNFQIIFGREPEQIQ
jgi:hypothetical protein